MITRRAFVYGAVVAGGALTAPGRATAAPAPITTDEAGDKIQTLPKPQLPAFADTADMRRLYRFAVEHGDDLGYVPCFCGCNGIGHRSNRDCYVKAVNPNGTVTYTSHAST